eukprot:TRINITY_DN8253_c0_g1_i3.p1 TRINITY_DN8253_c0_g1~~TRINITY_DN8253_c0_g1_i3.p1  ORF type:complete len:363 (-),score=58.95 TRINITY_DN8253_c0_g1_i3:39-1127(-)
MAALPLIPDPPKTGPVRKNHLFDKDALEKYLQQNLPQFKGNIQAFLQFDSGQSNPTFYLRDSENNEFVLRKKPPGKLLIGAHQIEREYKVMNALKTTNVPVPTLYLLCTDDSIIGTPFYIMKYIKGRVLDAKLIDYSPEERSLIYKAMARVLANLHSLDFKSIGLENFAKHGDYFKRQIDTWTRQYVQSKTRDIPEMDKLILWLPKLVPQEDEVCIVHGDFRLDNMLFHPTKPEVLAVLDWELSTLGHPLSDLAYNCVPYFYPEEFGGSIKPTGESSDGIPSFEEYLEWYCTEAKRPKIQRMEFPLAFSFFRSAAIMQGVHKRALQGNASSERALACGEVAVALAKTSWKICLPLVQNNSKL